MTTERERALFEFLMQAGHDDDTRIALPQDASARRYERLSRDDGTTHIVMDAPPEKGEDVVPFVRVTHLLRGAGLSAPDIVAKDMDQGFLLLEDLGHSLYATHLAADPADEDRLYECAVDVLVHLHQQPLDTDEILPYDTAKYLAEAALLNEWYVPGVGQTLRPQDESEYLKLISQAVEPALSGRVLVLRDYHAENLIWMSERTGIARVGLLDYQDALIGHPAYDLVSLLEDARRDTTEQLRRKMVQRYCDSAHQDPHSFALSYAALGAQRNLKIIGIFARLWLRDGKDIYLEHMPRVWSHLQRDLAHPTLAQLQSWVLDHVPAPTDDRLARLRAAR